MRNILSFLFLINCLLSTNPLMAQYTRKEFDIDLWPEGLPNTNGIDRQPFDDNTQNYKPSLRVFLPAEDSVTGRAVIACPGGAYEGLAYGYEGYDWAPYFNRQGIALIVLKYRMPRGNREVPFSDAEEAIRVVKEHAAEWRIDSLDIGIMGSSAGGHLASTMATHIKQGLRPAFQILFYPVITMDKSFTHMESRKNLLGNEPVSQQLEDLYSNEKQVKDDTPRAFIAYSDDDDAVSTKNGVYYYLALKEKKVPASLFIYPSGGHGWGCLKDFKHNKEMIQDLTSWLLSF